ncbi:MAG: hypothetical protein ABFC85_11515 [Rectinema sp.]
MTRDFCWSQLERLEIHFGKLDERNASVVKNDYYEHLKVYTEDEMSQAVFTLIDSFKYRRFPLIRDIREVLDRVKFDAQSAPTAEEAQEYYDHIRCETCGDTGYILNVVSPSEYKLGMSSATASFCACRAGEVKRKAWESYLHSKQERRQIEHDRRFEPQSEY